MSEAEYKRFIANEPESWIEYRTLEIYHPQTGIHRFVNKRLDQSLGIEIGAPRNPGATVTFSAANFIVTEPAENEQNDQTLSVSFANVDSTVQDIIDLVSGSGYLDQIEVVYRKYYSNDLTSPAISPLYVSASSVSFGSSSQANFTAEDINLTTRRVGSIYTTEIYPGLAID